MTSLLSSRGRNPCPLSGFVSVGRANDEKNKWIANILPLPSL